MQSVQISRFSKWGKGSQDSTQWFPISDKLTEVINFIPSTKKELCNPVEATQALTFFPHSQAQERLERNPVPKDEKQLKPSASSPTVRFKRDITNPIPQMNSSLNFPPPYISAQESVKESCTPDKTIPTSFRLVKVAVPLLACPSTQKHLIPCYREAFITPLQMISSKVLRMSPYLHLSKPEQNWEIFSS
jgi:hypothetical protein